MNAQQLAHQDLSIRPWERRLFGQIAQELTTATIAAGWTNDSCLKSFNGYVRDYFGAVLARETQSLAGNQVTHQSKGWKVRSG